MHAISSGTHMYLYTCVADVSLAHGREKSSLATTCRHFLHPFSLARGRRHTRVIIAISIPIAFNQRTNHKTVVNHNTEQDNRVGKARGVGARPPRQPVPPGSPSSQAARLPRQPSPQAARPPRQPVCRQPVPPGSPGERAALGGRLPSGTARGDCPRGEYPGGMPGGTLCRRSAHSS